MRGIHFLLKVDAPHQLPTKNEKKKVEVDAGHPLPTQKSINKQEVDVGHGLPCVFRESQCGAWTSPLLSSQNTLDIDAGHRYLVYFVRFKQKN